MTAYPTPARQGDTLDVVWRELHRGQGLHLVPPHGLARPPHATSPPPYLREVWELSGRSEETPGKARSLVSDTCRRWRVAHRIVPDLKLIVSELATNAITHAPGERVTVAVLLTATDVWVVVIDKGPQRSFKAGQFGADDEHGRGLVLVEALADRSAVLPVGDGTAVWAARNLPPRRALPETFPVHAPTPNNITAPHTIEDRPDAPRSH